MTDPSNEEPAGSPVVALETPSSPEPIATISPAPAEIVPNEPEDIESRAYSPEQKAKAYEHYLINGLNPREISMELAIPASTISSWIQNGKWKDRKVQIEKEMFELAESKYRRFIVEEKLPTAQRHLAAAKIIEEKIAQVAEKIKVDGKMADVKLVRAAKALSDSSNVSARAVGLSDKPQEHEEDDKKKRTPLVVIGIQGTAPVTIREG